MKLKHVKTITKRNGVRFTYLAIPGHKLVRLPDGPKDSPEFLIAYATALSASGPELKGRPVATGSIAAAIISYQRGSEFAEMANTTKQQRKGHLSKIADTWGRARLADLRIHHIEADLAKLSGHPANNRLKTWRSFCRWAKARRLITNDPSIDIGKSSTAKSDGFVPWSIDDIEAFREYWHPESAQRLALELIYWTAARASDAVRIGPGMVTKDGWLTFRQKKTGGEVSVPFNRTLPAFAVGMKADLDMFKLAISHAPRHMTWLVTEHGKARSDKAFSSWFAGAARAAGIEGKSAHGLRKARAMALAEAGATAHQIAAWTGHESLSEVQRYSKAADRKRILSRVDEEQVLETEPTQTGNHNAST
ncbi:tyrosine-type recombinase/integrase [Paracoccus laeviglucosivorans]|uniref:Site-specific recombinase XerD n=1 Tax=Paracoccus laeviglucosivorans TaxID=1197861 RepID=A0A521E660_9RHOB|nr:tyrosine-type recombinase/integrase [Paracoccus laeviglucosivorans]SMO79424.1 Site-specific recombinase XerD [Paracoccus laeviglucosivorans]